MSINTMTSPRMKFSFENITTAKKAKTIIEANYPSVITYLIPNNASLIVKPTNSINIDIAIEKMATSVGGVII